MAAFLDLCRFTPTLGGTTDFIFSAAVAGCQSPALAGIANGVKYKWYAVSNDLTQWELSEGAYNTGTGTASRTTVLANSSGTGTSAGQSGAGTKINFSTVPQVMVVALAEDLVSVEVANSFTAAQQSQARANLGGLVMHQQVFTAGGTFTTPAGSSTSTVYRYRMVGGGGGGGGANGNGAVGGGGAAGVYGEGTFTGVAPSTGIAITIGAAGAAGSAAGGAGGGGGDTIIGSPVSVTAGGSGGGAGNTAAGSSGGEGGSSGAATGSFAFSILGQHGGRGWSTAAGFGAGGVGGSNPLGYGGIPGSLNVAQSAIAAVGYGAGGAGAFLLATVGVAGTAGIVIIEWVL